MLTYALLCDDGRSRARTGSGGLVAGDEESTPRTQAGPPRSPSPIPASVLLGRSESLELRANPRADIFDPGGKGTWGMGEAASGGCISRQTELPGAAAPVRWSGRNCTRRQKPPCTSMPPRAWRHLVIIPHSPTHPHLPPTYTSVKSIKNGSRSQVLHRVRHCA